MKLTIKIFYVLAFLLITFKSGEATISYGSLIKDVYYEYKTFGIIMAADRNDFTLEKITMLQKLSREISARGIGSVVVNFGKLEATVKFHQRPSGRPLVVIFLDGMTELHEFRKEIVAMDMSYSVWLVLFTGDSDRDSCKYCRYPTGNPFNLKFNTDMLVSCCNSSDIAKWSPKKMNYTDTLSHNKGIEEVHEIESHQKGSPYNHSQLVDIEALRIVIITGSGDIWIEKNELHGYVGEIVTELSRVMNFSISSIMEESTSGAFDSETSMWTGAIGAVIQGKADIGASQFSMTSQRRSAVDFTSSIGRGKPGFYYQNPHHLLTQWTSFLKVFHPNVWVVIVIFLLITPILLTIIQYTRRDNLFDIISKNYLNVWGLFCQQGSSDSVHGGTMRMIYLAILISSIIVYASYSAAFIRHLATSTEHAPFRNMKDFIKYGTHELIAIKNGANYQWIETNNDTETKQIRRFLKPKDSLPTTYEEGFKQVCKEKVVFFDNQAGQYLLRNEVPCEILSFNTGEMYHAGMILPRNSKYTELVNYHIRRFRNNGMLDRMKRKYYTKRNQADISLKFVTFQDVLPILTIFAVGSSIAFVTFCIEKSFNYFKK